MSEATMTVETTEPKAKVEPPSPADLRALVMSFNNGAPTRARLTDADREALANIVSEAGRVKLTYPGGYNPRFGEEWGRVTAKVAQYANASQDVQVVSLASGGELRIPIVENEIMRDRLYKNGIELVAAIDGYIKSVNDAAERLAEGLRQQVGIFDQLVASDPIAAALVSALSVLRQQWVRYLAGDVAAGFDGDVNDHVLAAIRRIVVVKRIPLHTHMLQDTILPAWEAQKKADETAKAAVDVPQRGKRTR